MFLLVDITLLSCSLTSVRCHLLHPPPQLITTTTQLPLSPHAHRRPPSSPTDPTRPEPRRDPSPTTARELPLFSSKPLPNSSCPKMPFYSAICYAIAMPSLKKSNKKGISHPFPLGQPSLSSFRSVQIRFPSFGGRKKKRM